MNIETPLYSFHYSNWFFLNSNQDQRWKRDSSHSEDINSSKVQGSVNIFSNDGSFLDQFKKLSGVKGEQERCHFRLKKHVTKSKWCIVVPRKTFPYPLYLLEWKWDVGTSRHSGSSNP